MRAAIDLKMLDHVNISIDDLSRLPFNHVLHTEIENRIRQVFNQIILRKDKSAQVLLVSYKAFLPLSNYLYLKVFQMNALNMGIELVFDAQSNDFINLFHKGFSEVPVSSRRNSGIRILKTGIKNIIRNVRSLNLRYFDKPVLIHNSISDEIAKSVFPKNRRVFFSYNYWNTVDNVLKGDLNLIEELCEEVIDDFLEISFSYAVSPSESDLNLLKKLIFPRFVEGMTSLLRVEKIKVSKYQALLIDTPRSELNKSIAIKFKSNGIPVFEFLHGHQHVLDWDYYSWAEFPFITHLLTKADYRNDLKYLMKRYPTLMLADPEILLEHAAKETEFKSEIQGKGELLLIGAAFKNFGDLSQSTSLPEIQQYVIEKRIEGFFNKSNNDIYYKAHPEGKYKGNLKHIWGERIVNGFFEDVHENFNGFIFYSTRSSVFPIALRTNKPIYIIDVGTERYTPETMIQLNKRCILLKYEEII